MREGICMVKIKSKCALIKTIGSVLLSLIVVNVLQGIVFANEQFQQIDIILQDAFQHARNYPPEFDSQVQRENLEKDLENVIVLLEQMLKEEGLEQELLFRLGQANTFAFNLDMTGSKEKTDEYFGQLFKLEPDHAQGNLFYGQHLSGRGEFDASIEHLQIAADAGLDVALNMIGLAYLQMGKTDEAKEYFLKFQAKYPNEPQIKMLLNSLDPSGEHVYKPMKE